MLDKRAIEKISEMLLRAEKERAPIEPISSSYTINVKDAYRIQVELIKKKRAEGYRRVGWKVGLTSKASQQAFGAREPIYGRVLDKLVLDSGSSISVSELISPKFEVEIAFILKEPITELVPSTVHLLRKIDYVVGSFEIVDSRYKNWAGKVEDIIADNSFFARAVVGSSAIDAYDIDLPTVGVVVKKNGEIIGASAGGIVMGNPLKSLMWLANELISSNRFLKEGDIVLTGSLIPPTPFKEGDHIVAEFGYGLGTVEFFAGK